MPNRLSLGSKFSFRIHAFVFVAAGSLCFSTPALAGFQPVGFQWVSPAEAPPPPAYQPQNNWAPSAPMEAPPPMMPSPSAQVTKAPQASTSLAGSPEIISPIVIEGTPLTPANTSTPSVPAQGQNASLGTLPEAAAPDIVVQGFANNVPLAVALRQVLPAGYGFSIDQDVDLGTLVSFQGGKPWRETLQAMLQPVELTMREQNKMVAISRAQGSGVIAPPPEAPAPMPMASAAPNSALGAYIPPNPYPPAAPTPPWPGSTPNGPRPQLAQPSVSYPPLPPPPPPVSSSRVSSTSIVDTWTASRGDTLHKVLTDWSQRAGTELEWLAEYDYPLQASLSFTGTFEEAVRSMLSGFEEAHPQPVAELHSNPGAGHMVLVIQTRGNSYID